MNILLLSKILNLLIVIFIAGFIGETTINGWCISMEKPLSALLFLLLYYASESNL